MNVRVRAFARFRELLGGDMEIEIPAGATISDVLRKACSWSDEACEAVFDASGEVRSHVILMRNGTRMDRKQAGSTAAAEGDEIVVFPPVSGG